MKYIYLVVYSVILILFAVFTWSFIDANFPLREAYLLSRFVWYHRALATTVYLALIVILFVCYGHFLLLVERKKANLKYIFIAVGVTIVILLFSWPAFAYDIFNYIATAKVAFLYRENPYIVMPVEIPNESLLAFMHAANKVALYGFAWILLTFIPWQTGLGNLILTVFTFKVYMLLFYGICLVLIWHLSGKNLRALTFFALNPLVILETLISAHNDVVMMALALSAFYFFRKYKYFLSIFMLFLSIFVKFATLALIPIFIYLFYVRHKQRKIEWKKIWLWSALAMYIPFFLSPLREEIYSWYLIWPLTFVSLALEEKLLAWVTVGFSIGLPLRFVPFLYTGDWGGLTPLVKKIVTFVPPALTASYYEIKKKI